MPENTVDKVNVDVNVNVNSDADTKLNKLSKNFKAFGDVMNMNNKDFAKNHETLKKSSLYLERFATKIRLATSGLHGFRMEMLSVMFFGMSMKNFFGQWVTSVSDLLGINDLFNTSMQLVVLQALQPFLDIIYGLLGAFLSLDEGTQKAIGTIVLLGYGLGSVLSSIGQIALGIGGLQQLGVLKWAQDLWGVFSKYAKIVFDAIWKGSGLQMAAESAYTFLKEKIWDPASKVVFEADNKIFSTLQEKFDAAMTPIFGAKGAGWVRGAAGAGITLYSAINLKDVYKDGSLDVMNSIMSGLGIYSGLRFGGLSSKYALIWTVALELGAILTEGNLMGYLESLINVLVKLVALPIKAIGLALKAAFSGNYSLSDAWSDISSSGYNILKKLQTDTSSFFGIGETATGGIVTGPQVRLVGEAGPEAIIPLSRMNEMVTNNSPTIIVNANVSSSYDVKELANELSQYMGLNINRSAYL